MSTHAIRQRVRGAYEETTALTLDDLSALFVIVSGADDIDRHGGQRIENTVGLLEPPSFGEPAAHHIVVHHQ
ncbi:hypothetical protein GEMMAAP_12525 [Gemmatimonas phototrophica]|uniref:Uncharacterized protein n=1 Tax=Gemmatimonas phototrophica TaxID=1379270 RepID=A0A143BK04_9BACT|nr:hypothetical protein GEMMAAP_12525 [Gemmatimonas phototrophica]